MRDGFSHIVRSFIPPTEIVIYQESEGDAPLVDWLVSLPVKVQVKCDTMIKRLGEFGYELRRPESDYLRDGIHELRIGHRRTNYRILYTYIGQQITLLTHGIVKEDRVPTKEIEEAILRKAKWVLDPITHTYER
jgi:phage-related protein